MTDLPTFSASPTPLAWRDSVLRKLLELSRPGGSNAATLTEIDPAGATIFLSTLGRLLVFIPWPDEDPFAAVHVAQRIDSIAASLRPGMKVDLVAVGGGQSARQICEDRANARLGRGQLVFHHLLEDGRLWNAGAPPPPPLEAALKEIRSELARGENLRPFTTDEITAARDSFRRLATAEQAAIKLLTTGKIPATLGLLAVLVAVFGLEFLWCGPSILSGGVAASPTLFRMGAADGAALRAGEWWRLFTPAFLHGSLLHIGVNGYSLWIAGGMVERLFGSARFLVIYGISAFVAAIASSVFGTGMSVGASGALFGLLGTQVALALRPQGVLPANLAGRLRRGLVGPLILNIGISTVPGIDWHAHLGGAIAGFALVILGLPSRGLPPLEVRAVAGARSRGWSAAALVIILTMAAALGAAFGHGKPWDNGVGPSARVTLPGTHLSLSVPTRLPLSREEHTPGKNEFVYGWPGKSEIVVEVLVAPDPDLAQIPGPALREQLLQHAQGIRENGLRITDPAAVTDTPEGPVAFVGGRIEDWHLAAWLTVRGNSWVRIDVNYDDDSPPEWKALAPRFVESLRLEQ